MERIFKIIGKALSTTLISIVVLLTILLAGVRLIGLTPYTVLSGSMEPNYHVGSVVYVKKVAPASLKVGDAITYRLTGNTIVTHRIIEIHGEDMSGLGFRTKGDANKTEDGVTPAEAVIGKVIFSIPYIGYISNFIQKPIGLICIVGTSTVVLIISFAIDAIFSKEKDSESESGSEENNG